MPVYGKFQRFKWWLKGTKQRTLTYNDTRIVFLLLAIIAAGVWFK